MDCRKRMVWSLALVSGLAGCTTTGTNNTSATNKTTVVPPSQVAQIDPAEIKKESDLPKTQPTPRMCVAWGNVAADEAEHKDSNSVETNDLRDQARKAYQKALQLDPKYVDAYLSLAKLYLAMQDDAHALATLDTATKEQPKAAGLYYFRGMMYSRRKEWQPAIDNLAKAAELEPENRTYVDTLGHALARAGRTQEALQTFLRVNSEAKAYYNIARMAQHMNQPDLSQQCLLIALQKDPQMKEAQQMVAELNGGNPSGVEQAGATSPEPGNVEPVPVVAPN